MQNMIRLLILAFPWSFLLVGPFETSLIPTDMIVALLLVYTLMLRVLLIGKLTHFKLDLWAPLVLLSLVWIVAGLTSVSSVEALKSTFTVIPLRVGLACLIYICITSEGDLQKIASNLSWIAATVTVIGALVLIVTGDIGYFRSGIYSSKDWLSRTLQGTVFGNPNYLARTILLVFPFSFLRSLKTNQKGRIFWLIIVLGQILMVFLTQSRMGIVTLGVELFILLYYNRKRLFKGRNVIVIVILLTAFLILILNPLTINRFTHKLIQLHEYGTTLRLEMVAAAWNSFVKYPFFGIGPGNAKHFLSQYPKIEKLLNILGKEEFAAHNNFILIGLESGTLGLLSFLWFLASYWRHTGWLSRKARLESTRRLIQGVRVAFLGFVLTGLTAVNLGMDLAWYIFALFFAAERLNRKENARCQIKKTSS